MRLTKFRIKNFKSIVDSGDCEILNDNVIILAGQNESGKSNILEALSKFEIDEKITSEALPDGIDNVIPEIICTFSIDINEINDITDFEKIPNALKYILLDEKSISIHKTYPNNEYSFDERIVKSLKDVTYTDNRDDDKPLEDFSNKNDDTETIKPEDITDEKSKDSNQKKTKDETKSGHFSLAKNIVRYTPYFIYYESFNDKLPKKIYLSQINNEETIGYRAVNDFIDLADISVKHLQNEKDVKSVDNYLEKKSATVTGNFLNYWTQKVDGESHVRIVTERNHDENGYFLSFFVKDDSSKKYPEQRSKGFLWFLSFYLRLNAEKRNNKDNGTIVLIDEPGSYLHSKAQKDVLRILENEIATSGNQVIFSTHSSDLIDPNKLNRIRLVVNRKGKGTKIISKFHGDQDDDFELHDALSPIVRAIGKDIGTGFDFVAKKNVLLEGISDYYYLTALRSHPKLSISDDIKLIPMTGVLTIRHMASLMIGWGLDFVVVMDNDGNTKKEYETLTRELNIDEKRIHRIQNAKMIEYLFSENDFKKYVKPELNTDSNNKVENGEKVLLSHRFYNDFTNGNITIDETTITNFKKLFTFIDNNFK